MPIAGRLKIASGYSYFARTGLLDVERAIIKARVATRHTVGISDQRWCMRGRRVYSERGAGHGLGWSTARELALAYPSDVAFSLLSADLLAATSLPRKSGRLSG
jgi:hypothetical protein